MGQAGEALVINAKSQVVRGSINAINGVEVIWCALKQVVPK
jgi:hypothetical protein